MLDWIKSIFSAEKNSVSSKRVMGVLAWLTVLVSYAWCSFKGLELPGCTDFVVTTASAMLGLDSITSAFSKNKSE